MSEAAVDSGRGEDGLFVRIRRTIALSGLMALAWGLTVGALTAFPQPITAYIGIQPGNDAIVIAGMWLGGMILGLMVGLLLRGKSSLLRWVLASGAFLFMLLVACSVQYYLNGSVLQFSLDPILTLGTAFGLGMLNLMVGIRIGKKRQTQSVSRQPPRRVETSPSISVGERIKQFSLLRAAKRKLSQVNMPEIKLPTFPFSVPSIRIPDVPLFSGGDSGSGGVRIGNNGRIRTGVRQPLPAPKRGIKVGRGRAKNGGGEVRLGKQETAICPYCLEEVLPRDPRGVHVCEICGTPHHGDCWAITGKCEVPHLQF